MASDPTPALEEPLTGGRYTAGVVRVGDTVRRPAGLASPFMGRLLAHLEAAGFAGVPRHLGRDERGRDVLTFIPGWVPERFQFFADGQIAAAAGLMRAFHDATRGSDLAAGAEVVCHHDPGPNNVIFVDHRPTAFIDFDFAAPGAAIEDLGYMGWTWCVSSRPDRGPVEVQARQVKVLADAYGLDGPARRDLPDAMIERQSRNIGFWTERLDGLDGLPTPVETIRERIAWSRREMQFTSAHRDLFLAALTV